MPMTNPFEHRETIGDNRSDDEESKWGARLFIGTLFVVLTFFWWLLIYSGGVAGHHG